MSENGKEGKAHGTELTTKIRYGREKKPTFIVVDDGEGGQKIQRVRASPRNTLVTISDGKTIWFGISRCCKNDTFDKDLGVAIAFGRAQALLTQSLESEDGTGLLINEDGLSGWAGVESAEKLVKYFEAAIFPGKRQKETTKAEAVVFETFGQGTAHS